MTRKRQIAVIGAASATLSPVQQVLAYQTGHAVIDSGCRLITGGMGGVMEYASKGARESQSYHSGDIVGILPSYQSADANPFVDIVLPSGLGIARNAVLMASCDAVIALDGGSGTLSEIALAWQMQKPIACIGQEGWHKKLSSLNLDGRRQDSISVLESPAEIAEFIALLSVAPQASFAGIQKSKLSFEQAINFLKSSLDTVSPATEFKLLGNGSEGIAVTDGKQVYKLFYPNDYKMLLYSNLNSLSKQLKHQAGEPAPVPGFECFKAEYLVVHYPDFVSSQYQGGGKEALVGFLRKMKSSGLCLSNVKAENFRLTETGELVWIDIGRDLIPYTEPMFDSMCRRAFLTMLFSDHPQFRQFCRYTNTHDDFSAIATAKSVAFTPETLQNLFDQFYKEASDAL